MKNTKLTLIFIIPFLLFASCAAPSRSAESAAPAATQTAETTDAPESGTEQYEQTDDSAQTPSPDYAEEYASIARALAGLLDVYITTGQPYPPDGVSSDYAESYLYFVANQFYVYEAVPYEFENYSFDKYVVWDKKFGDALLKRAFGAEFSPDMLEPTNTVYLSDGKYYVGIGEPAETELTYTFDTAQDINPDTPYRFGYSYELTDDDGIIFGMVTAWLDRDDEGFAHIYAIDADETLAQFAQRNG